MIAQLHQAVRDLKRRMQMSVGRAVLAAVDDTTQAQSLQLELLADEVADGVERFQNYGHTSVPLAGAEAVMVAVGGLRSHGIVVAVEDRRYRLKGLQGGEVAMYDDQGQQVVLMRDQILITSSKKVVVHSDVEIDFTGPKATLSTDAVNLGGEGGAKVARVGDSVVGGVIATGSSKVTAVD